MPLWLKAAGKWGSIFVLIALLIAFVKQLIFFIGFLTFAIKAVIVLAFLALFIGVAVVIFRSWQQRQDRKSKS